MPPSLVAASHAASGATVVTLPDRITCPSCGAPIPLEDAFAQRFQAYYDQHLADAIASYARDRESLEARERAAIVARAVADAEQAQAIELAAAREEVSARRAEITTLQQNEIALRTRTRELEAKELAIAVTIEREVDERVKAVAASVRSETEERHRFHDGEREARLLELQRQLETMQRTARQGPAHLQGEVAEADLQSRLRQAFPGDRFARVNRGVREADLRHEVIDARGHPCGVIVWESKNTKAFTEGWLPKLRSDQRAVGADLAVLVSTTLPESVRHFAYRGHVWVSSWATAVPLAQALRASLFEIARARATATGRTEKQTALFAYVTSVEFRQRIESILEPLVALAEELARERRATEAGWAKRERHLQATMTGLAELYGDVAGIAGGGVPRIARLELPSGK